jgi:hypothetical protein
VLDVLDLLDERLLRVERLALVGLDGEEGVPGDVDGVDIEQAEVEGDELKRVRLRRLTTSSVLPRRRMFRSEVGGIEQPRGLTAMLIV